MCTDKKIIVKDTFYYSVASYIAIAVGLFVSIMAKRILGVEGAGFWALLVVVQSYGMYVGLGIKDALVREVPQSVGAKQFDKVGKIQDVAFSYLIISCLAGAVIISILSFFITKDPVFRTGMWAVAVLILATHLYNLMLTILRAKKQILSLSKVIVLNTFLVAAFPLTGAYFFGVVGFAAGMVVATALSFYFAKSYSGISFRFDLDWQETFRLIKIGGVMLFSSLLFRTFLSIDKIMIGKMLGIEMLGFYTIGLMAVTQLGSLPRFFNIVIFPHIQEEYGATKDLTKIGSKIMKPTYLISRLVPIIVGLLIFVLQPLVYYILPQFGRGLDAMKILLFGYFFVVANEMSTTLIFTINKQKVLIPFYAVLIGAGVGLNYLFIKIGWGITGVALGTAIAYFLFFITVFTFAAKHIMRLRNLLRFYLGLIFYYIYFVALILLIDTFIKVPNMLIESGLKIICLGLVSIPALIEVQKKEKIFSLLGSVLKEKFSGMRLKSVSLDLKEE